MNATETKSPARSLAALLPYVAREVREARKSWKGSRLLGVRLLDFGTESRVALEYYAEPTPALEGARNGSPGSIRFYVLGTFPVALTKSTPGRSVSWSTYFGGRFIGRHSQRVPRRLTSRPLVGIYAGAPAIVAGHNIAAEGGPLGKGERLPHFVIVPTEPETGFVPRGRPLNVKVIPL